MFVCAGQGTVMTGHSQGPRGVYKRRTLVVDFSIYLVLFQNQALLTCGERSLCID